MQRRVSSNCRLQSKKRINGTFQIICLNICSICIVLNTKPNIVIHYHLLPREFATYVRNHGLLSRFLSKTNTSIYTIYYNQKNITGLGQNNPFPPPAVDHTITGSKCYNGGLEQTNPFLVATVDRTNNGPLRTNSSITPPPPTKIQKQSFVRTLVYKTPPHSPTKCSADQICNEGTSYNTKNDIYNKPRDDSSKYV